VPPDPRTLTRRIEILRDGLSIAIPPSSSQRANPIRRLFDRPEKSFIGVDQL
jgi:hypothetical protein